MFITARAERPHRHGEQSAEPAIRACRGLPPECRSATIAFLPVDHSRRSSGRLWAEADGRQQADSRGRRQPGDIPLGGRSTSWSRRRNGSRVVPSSGRGSPWCLIADPTRTEPGCVNVIAMCWCRRGWRSVPRVGGTGCRHSGRCGWVTVRRARSVRRRHWLRPLRPSASPTRPCCTRSNAVNSPPFTSPAANETGLRIQVEPVTLGLFATRTSKV
jgi:hypothetical protein